MVWTKWYGQNGIRTKWYFTCQCEIGSILAFHTFHFSTCQCENGSILAFHTFHSSACQCEIMSILAFHIIRSSPNQSKPIYINNTLIPLQMAIFQGVYTGITSLSFNIGAYSGL